MWRCVCMEWRFAAGIFECLMLMQEMRESESTTPSHGLKWKSEKPHYILWSRRKKYSTHLPFAECRYSARPVYMFSLFGVHILISVVQQKCSFRLCIRISHTTAAAAAARTSGHSKISGFIFTVLPRCEAFNYERTKLKRPERITCISSWRQSVAFSSVPSFLLVHRLSHL